MTLEITVAELARATELELGSSPWRRIEQDRINMFASATDDHQWIHVDPELASAGPYGATIAHGYLTLSLIPAMFKELMVVTDHGRGTNYGLEKVRFTAPVHVGSEVRLTASISDSTLREDGGVQYRVALCIGVKGQDRPAMVGESIYLAYPRA